MKCIHPRSRKYFDPYSGEERVCVYPCGKCAACLHNEQDSWSIRLQETAAHEPHMIYDTFTIADSNLQWIDNVSDPIYNGDVELTSELSRILLDSGYKHKPYSSSLFEARLPYLDKKVLSDFIKAGRDAYRYAHGFSPHLRYFGCLEYGPKWARPHVHLVVFGVSWDDWLTYWSNPWKESMGFTKPKFIKRGAKNSIRSRQCISRYVSKYVNKGSFEVATVKAGLQPKAWKIVSHGIGEEYVYSHRFDWLRTRDNFVYSRLYAYFEYRNVRPRFNTFTFKWELHTYKQRLFLPHSLSIPDFKLSHDELNSVTCYVDESGFNHKLPRYYFYKLFGYKANLLKYEVQNFILADARERRDKEISRIASGLTSGRTCVLGSEASSLGLSCSLRYLAAVVFDSQQENKARMECARRFDMLNNHYKRPLIKSRPNIILNS